MKRIICSVALLAAFYTGSAQSYNDSVMRYRQQYKHDFLTDAHSPLKAKDTSYLRFYAADNTYRVVAAFARTPGSKPFLMPTHSGKDKPFKEYGILSFSIHDTELVLHVYQGIDMMNDPNKNYLFIPFTDLTNYEETFGGGRYIDLSTTDIHDNTYLLDFNKCYNPYCAYAEGYSCPIPPQENSLKIEIRAGEKLFGKTQ